MHSIVLMEQIAILFLIIGIGFVARQQKILDKTINKGLTDLLLNITAPALILSSFTFHFSETLLINAFIVLGASLVIHLASFGLAKMLFRNFPMGIRKILIFTTVFSNCGFMGYPIMESVYGKLGIFYSSLYVVGFNLVAWTLGIVIFTEKPDWRAARSVLINPGVISVAAGMVLFVFSIKLPLPISKTIDLVGSITTPLSMIIVGSILAECDLKQLFSGLPVYYGALVRLIILPLLTFAVLKLFPAYDPILSGVCILSVSMPAAAMTALFAEKYDGDAVFASRAIFLSTALSIITVPLLLVTLIMK